MPSDSGMFRKVVVLAAILCLSGGCVNFEKETIIFVFPRNSPKVELLLIYEGLRVSKTLQENEQAALTKAKEQLSSFVTQEKQFCLGDNFLLHFDLADNPRDDLTAKAQKLLLRQNLTVRNGAFFIDKSGKLGGYQRLSVSDGSRLVTHVNAIASGNLGRAAHEALEKPPADRPRDFDEETLQRIRQAAQDKFAWFKLEPGRISFTLPATPRSVAAIRKGILLKADSDTRSLVAENTWSLDQRANQVTIALGLGEGHPIRFLSQPMEPKPYNKVDEELLAYARTLKLPFEDNVDLERMIARFIRDASRSGEP